MCIESILKDVEAHSAAPVGRRNSLMTNVLDFGAPENMIPLKPSSLTALTNRPGCSQTARQTTAT